MDCTANILLHRCRLAISSKASRIACLFQLAGDGTTGASGTGPALRYSLKLKYFILFIFVLILNTCTCLDSLTIVMKIMFNYIFNFGIKICPKLSIFLIEFTEPKFTFSLTRARTERLKWRCVKKSRVACMHGCGSNPESEKGKAQCSLQVPAAFFLGTAPCICGPYHQSDHLQTNQVVYTGRD